MSWCKSISYHLYVKYLWQSIPHCNINFCHRNSFWAFIFIFCLTTTTPSTLLAHYAIKTLVWGRHVDWPTREKLFSQGLSRRNTTCQGLINVNVYSSDERATLLLLMFYRRITQLSHLRGRGRNVWMVPMGLLSAIATRALPTNGKILKNKYNNIDEDDKN